MKITFTETEESDRRLFEEALGAHELSFVDALADVMPDAEVVSIFKASHIDDAFLVQHPALHLVATRSTTHDHIDLESCARHGVAVAAVASYGDHIVAEHTFALLLALTRRLREAMRLNGDKLFSYEKLRGVELHGKTFGILGAGRVGMQTVPIARAFGMKVLAHDIAPQPEAAVSLGFEYVSFEDLLRRSHFLSLHAPLTDDDFHILDREAFAQCRPGILIINTARGQLIDTAALLEALDAGIVGGAGLDVLGKEEEALRRQASHRISDQIIDHLHADDATAPPGRSQEIEKLMLIDKLLARPNVVFTPHIAFNCVESIERIHAATVANITRFLNGIPTGIPSPEIDRETSVKPSDEFCLAQTFSHSRLNNPQPTTHQSMKTDESEPIKADTDLHRTTRATEASSDLIEMGPLTLLRSILVPLDFSEPAEKALRYAVAFGRRLEARITLLHVRQLPYYLAEPGFVPAATPIDDPPEAATQRLEADARRLVPPEILERTLLRVGTPFDEICKAAAELNTDLIILSTHGYTGLKHVLMGSTAERVVRHAPCPVLVVRKREHEFV